MGMSIESSVNFMTSVNSLGNSFHATLSRAFSYRFENVNLITDSWLITIRKIQWAPRLTRRKNFIKTIVADNRKCMYLYLKQNWLVQVGFKKRNKEYIFLKWLNSKKSLQDIYQFAYFVIIHFNEFVKLPDRLIILEVLLWCCISFTIREFIPQKSKLRVVDVANADHVYKNNISLS